MIHIDRQALVDFVRPPGLARRDDTAPNDLADEAPLDADDLTLDDLRAVWLGVGISTQIGRALIEAPERFVTDRPRPPNHRAEEKEQR